MPTRPPASKILDHKPEEDILSPTAVIFVLSPERSYPIYPMPDSALMLVAGDLAQVVRLADGILGNVTVGAEGLPSFNLQPRDILPLIPQIVQILIPNATRIIAACLRVDAEFVSSHFSIAKRLEALTLIVQAEDLPLIAKNWQGLLTTFQTATPTTQGG